MDPESICLDALISKRQVHGNNKNNPVQPNVQCWKDHAGVPSRTQNNSLNSGRSSNTAADFKNININGRRGGSSDTTTSRSSDIAADDSIIISGSLSGRGSQQRKEDLVRDPVAKLNSDGNQELSVDLMGV